MKKTFLIICLAGLLFPLVSQATGFYKIFQNGTEKVVCYEGLVPCGKPVRIADSIKSGKCENPKSDEVCIKDNECQGGKYIDEKTIDADDDIPAGYGIVEVSADGKKITIAKEIPCQFCHLPAMVLTIINFFLLPPTGIVFIVAVLMLTFGGALIIFSGGNPGRVTKGKTIITAAIIGLVIIYTGWIIVNEFLMYVGVSESGSFEALHPGKWNEVMFDCPIRLPK